MTTESTEPSFSNLGVREYGVIYKDGKQTKSTYVVAEAPWAARAIAMQTLGIRDGAIVSVYENA